MATQHLSNRITPWWIAVSAIAIAAAAGLSAWAAGGTQSFSVAYQGYLEDNGAAFTGTVDLKFDLYADAQAATASGWQETQAGVQVVAGRFSATLGETAALSAAVLKNYPFLGITITGRDGVALATALPLAGRQLMTAVPYAWRGAPGQNFSVDGNLDTAGSVAIGGSLSAATTATIGGAVSIGGTLGIGNALSIDGNVVIDDAAGWHRSYGNTGWYNGTYAGGWYMTDTTWVRSYNNKSVYTGTGTLRTDGDLVATSNAHGACAWVVSPWSCTWDIYCPQGRYVAGLRDTGGNCPREIYCCDL